MNQHRSRLFVALSMSSFGLAFVSPASASQAYPEALRAQLGLASIPEPPMGCLLCHKDLSGGFMTVTKPFGRSALKAGATGASVPSLRAALQALENAGTDSDFDGVGDIAELLAGTDPNVPEVVEGEPIQPPPQREEVPLPETGCSTSSAPVPGGFWPALALAVLALARGRRRRTAVLGSLAMLTFLGSGCQRKSDPTPGPAASVSATARAAAEGDALLHELVTVGKTCEPSSEHLQCPAGANWTLIGDFLAARRERSAALNALTTALGDPHAGVSALSANVLRSAFGGPWGNEQHPNRVEPEVATRLLSNTLKLPTNLAQQVVPAAVNAAMLAGQAETLYSELAKPQHAALRTSAYPYLMTLGRAHAFAKVQQLVKEGALAEAIAAAEAPLNMQAWTDSERLQICTWSETMLSDARVEVALAAGQTVATNCPGHWLDTLLKRGEALARTANFDAAMQKPLISMCSPAARASEARGTDAQCERARGLLMSVAESKKAAPPAREHAMKGLAKAWPDEATARVLKRLQRDSNDQVARAALDAKKVLDKTRARGSTLADEPVLLTKQRVLSNDHR